MTEYQKRLLDFMIDYHRRSVDGASSDTWIDAMYLVAKSCETSTQANACLDYFEGKLNIPGYHNHF
jgi:hypothetical protein